MKTPQEIKETITIQLNKMGKSANQMIKECALSSSLVSDLGRGRMPSADRLAIIANYLGVQIDYLLGNTNDPTPSTQKSRPANTEREMLINELLKRLEAETDIDILKDVSDYSDYVIERRNHNKK
ncbi:MAG: helix-turn-helix domain-containing protein [Oscillospiraceae bacterium]|nr:helix-turn-helix domain-containing protein [Oscillospiraceae bacterium]